MAPLNMKPDDILNEVSSFSKKLAQGMGNLMDIGEISEGVTPREVVYEEDKLKLYRYLPAEDTRTNKVPLLIVYALVNRPYMTDLQENRSTIRGLMDAGQDVYLIDWGYADDADRYLTMDDYINGYIDRCVDALMARHNTDKINLLGICQGGTFSLCYTALHAERVANLVTMVTPVDFQTPDNLLSRWAQQIDVDLLVDSLGNIPGDLLNWTFLTLKPYRLIGQKYLDMVDLLDDTKQVKNFLRMEKWIFDSPDLPGEVFRQFIKDCYQKNKLIRSQLEVGGQRVDLEQITMPLLNIYGRFDHLVPPEACEQLTRHVGSSDTEDLCLDTGHIGIYVSGRARQVPEAVADWLAERSPEPGRTAGHDGE